ncbi:MAG: hypothetical protein ACTHOE_08095 [Conexibacter sp.]
MPRSRKRGRREATAPAAERPRRRSSEERNAEVRAQLQPLAAGERPGWVTIAAVVAAAVGVLNIALYLAGVRVKDSTFAGTVGVGVVLLVAAVGMWRVRYWAVLGFEVLLGISCVVATLSLFVASNVAGALRAVIVLVVCGTLFWKLIRAMARIQMPERRPAP